MLRRSVAHCFDYGSVTRSEMGTLGESNYRMFFHINNKLISPFHDIPLNLCGKAHIPFVCEIPHERTEKMEVLLSEKFNAIAQDQKNGAPRFLPIKPKFNYGMFPQTYENPEKECLVSGKLGDGDPVDVVDITKNPLELGAVVPVRILGSFCFIDGGEADWKVIVSRTETDELNKHVLGEMFGFFENYKGPDSGNYIMDGRKVFSVGDTMDIIQCAHENYRELINSCRTTRSRGESEGRSSLHIWVPGGHSV